MKTLALFGMLLLSSLAHADDLSRQEPRSIGNERSERIRDNLIDPNQIIYQGTGCPTGTVSVVFAPDNLSFTVLFDRFIVETMPSTIQQRDTRNCKLIVPIAIPAGLQMEITRVDYKGLADLPRETQAQLKSSYAFAGSNGISSPVMLQYLFRGPLSEEYSLYAAGMRQNQRSSCGGATRIMIDNDLGLISRSRDRNAQVTLDTVDANSKLVYYVNWVRCAGGGGGGGGGGRPDPVRPPGPRPPRF